MTPGPVLPTEPFIAAVEEQGEQAYWSGLDRSQRVPFPGTERQAPGHSDQTEPISISVPLICASLLSVSGWEESQIQSVLLFSLSA